MWKVIYGISILWKLSQTATMLEHGIWHYLNPCSWTMLTLSDFRTQLIWSECCIFVSTLRTQIFFLSSSEYWSSGNTTSHSVLHGARDGAQSLMNVKHHSANSDISIPRFSLHFTQSHRQLFLMVYTNWISRSIKTREIMGRMCFTFSELHLESFIVSESHRNKWMNEWLNEWINKWMSKWM